MSKTIVGVMGLVIGGDGVRELNCLLKGVRRILCDFVVSPFILPFIPSSPPSFLSHPLPFSSLPSLPTVHRVLTPFLPYFAFHHSLSLFLPSLPPPFLPPIHSPQGHINSSGKNSHFIGCWAGGENIPLAGVDGRGGNFVVAWKELFVGVKKFCGQE